MAQRIRGSASGPPAATPIGDPDSWSTTEAQPFFYSGDPCIVFLNFLWTDLYNSGLIEDKKLFENTVSVKLRFFIKIKMFNKLNVQWRSYSQRPHLWNSETPDFEQVLPGIVGCRTEGFKTVQVAAAGAGQSIRPYNLRVIHSPQISIPPHA